MTWRNSAAYYAQSNGRAELAVKTAKRMLLGNCDDKGDIDNMRFARALLQFRNTPLQGINLSPAQILYGRELKDCMPTLQDALTVRKEWRIAADERDLAQLFLMPLTFGILHTSYGAGALWGLAEATMTRLRAAFGRGDASN